MGFGRFVCVALPFVLTLGSLAALLTAGLAGVADKNLWLFQINTTDLSISQSDAESLLGGLISRGLISRALSTPWDFGKFHSDELLNSTQEADLAAGGNITAADLNLYNLYDVGLWGYCYTAQNGSRECTKPEFNWASNALNVTEENFASAAALSGQNVTLPTDIRDAINTYSTVSKWAEVVFIIAYICLAVELFFGLFATCSRVFSCITFIVALVTGVAVGAAAGLSTALATIVVGAVDGTAKWYGVTASVDTGFLAAVWIAVVFAMGAGFFWLFTICCCAPDHMARRSGGRRGNRASEAEKLIPAGAYQPLQEREGEQRFSGNPYGYAPQYGAPRVAQRSDLAYEPYSHANV